MDNLAYALMFIGVLCMILGVGGFIVDVMGW